MSLKLRQIKTKKAVLFSDKWNDKIVGLTSIAGCVVVATTREVYIIGDEDSNTFRSLTQFTNEEPDGPVKPINEPVVE